MILEYPKSDMVLGLKVKGQGHRVTNWKITYWLSGPHEFAPLLSAHPLVVTAFDHLFIIVNTSFFHSRLKTCLFHNSHATSSSVIRHMTTCTHYVLKLQARTGQRWTGRQTALRNTAPPPRRVQALVPSRNTAVTWRSKNTSTFSEMSGV